jgi:FKBP-type peptidyl-prolyl cis-trans isomerase (trigger factor)
VNITVENLAPCKKLLRVELDAKAVDEAFDAVTKDYQKQAALPRLPARQGAAQPRAQEIYEADIKGEVKRKLIGDHYRKALEEKNFTSSAIPTLRKSSSGAGGGASFCWSRWRSVRRR